MIRSTLVAISLLSAAPLAAQAPQEILEERYDRALAAGYKALFLCGAIANAERAGITRTPESVHAWELTGVQAPLDQIIRDLPFEIVRGGNGAIAHVSVEWADEMPPRFAVHRLDHGCSIYPIGFLEADLPTPSEAEPTRLLARQMPLTKGYNSFNLERTQFFDETYGEGTRTTAVIVTNGLDEQAFYADGFGPFTPQRTWSVAKSIAATIIGAVSHRLDAEMTASAGLGDGPLDPRRAITVDHLLRMASGRYSDTPGNRTNAIYYGGGTVEEWASGWPLVHEPGSQFRYANNDTLMAFDAFREALEDNPVPDLLRSFGMRRTVAETDWQGRYVLSSQVWATAPDLLALGKLYLENARGSGRSGILPEGWTRYVSTPSGPQPEGRSWGYGAGFWLFNNHEGIPADTFFAAGNRGQYVVIVPSRDVVIVRRGEDPAGSRFDIEAFTRDVMAALDK